MALPYGPHAGRGLERFAGICVGCSEDQPAGWKEVAGEERVSAGERGPDAWDKSTEYTKDTIERFSKHWYPYPWPAATNIAGFSSGMEYPGVVFDGVEDKGPFFSG